MPNTNVPAAAAGLPIPSRRALLRGAPAVVASAATGGIVGAAAQIVSPKLFAITCAIEAHRATWVAYGEANDHLADVEETAPRRTDFDVTVGRGPCAARHSMSRGRDAILEDANADAADFREKVVASLSAMGMTPESIAHSVAVVDRRHAENLDEINHAFDAEADRLEGSGIASAERALDAASDAEEQTWLALLACPCGTLAEVQEKCSYLAGSARLRDLGMTDDAAVAFVRSLAGGSDA